MTAGGPPLRVAVIGTGFGKRVVAPTFAATPRCEVVEVVSARDDRAVRALCRRADLDLVAVHSPPFLHRDHVMKVLDAGHSVLCDKPFGVDAVEAESMHEAAEAAEAVHLVNFEFRYDPIRERMRELLQAGTIGDVHHVHWIHVSAGTRVPLRPHGWLFEAAKGGGWIGAWGSHVIDSLRWMLGEVRVARARRETRITERPDREGRVLPVDAEDGFGAWLELDQGTTVTIESTSTAPAALPPRITAIGTDGVLECVADARIVVRLREGERMEHERAGAPADAHLEPMQRWAGVVRDAVLGGEVPDGAPTFADGVACARVLDRLRTG